jgi:hypothetical protein
VTYPWNNSVAWDGDDPWPGPDGAGGPQTLTVTPEPDHVPPRVRIDIDDATGTLTTVTIRRLDPDGRYRNVRTSDDSPLPMDGGSGSVYDYEVPFGQLVTYSTDVAGGPSVTVTLDVGDVWLGHLQVPSRSVRIPTVVDLGSRSRPLDVGVFRVLEREDPITATAGARQAPGGTLTVRTYTDDERLALVAAVADGSVLLLNIPASFGFGIPTCYVQILDIEEVRVLDYGPWQWREWSLPYLTVGRPAGGTQAGITWDDIAEVGDDDYTAADGSAFETWDDVADAYDAWSELSAPTT